MTFTRSLSGEKVGEHRVDPATKVTVKVTAQGDGPLRRAAPADTFASAWSVVDAGGGAVSVIDATTSRITWPPADVQAGTAVSASYTLAAPAVSDPPKTYNFGAELAYDGGTARDQPYPVTVSSPVVADHYRFGKDTPLSAMEWYTPTDAPLAGMRRFEPFRIRFQVSNRDTRGVEWKPRLEWSSEADRGFQPIQAGNTADPLYAYDVPTIQDGDAIPTSQLALGKGHGTPEPGKAYDQRGEAPVQTLGREGYTEIEFSLRATTHADWQTPYYLRLTDAGSPLSATTMAKLTMGDAPPLTLTQPQFSGAPAGSAVISRAQATLAAPQAVSAAGPFANPHVNAATTVDTCATCHRTHTGQNRNLLTRAEPQANVCFACHDGTGASANVAAQYSDPNVPADNPATSSYYRHAATATGSGHVSSLVDEFKGVLNRHSECGDCHSPHQADPAAFPAMTATGWTASGAEQGISGVGVTNGAAGSAPAYAWKTAITYEYELCFKCHSGYTTLLSFTKESYKKTDKGAELNPANAGFHPVEAAGKNVTTAMTNSLSGTSPYKLWTFTAGQEVRCVHCHGNYRLATPASPPATSARLAPHTSRYRGLLMNNYRDRNLKSSTESYAAADFALCYQCHAEAPFRDTGGNTRTDTNYRYHGFHVSGISGVTGGSTSLDIDTPGAGQDSALCAECHYRVHSTTFAVNSQQNQSRLVNFAPNVTGPTGTGSPVWNGTSRTCSLRCHGMSHSSLNY